MLQKDEEVIGDDFENLYKGEISKSGVPILPSKRARKIPEKIQVLKEDLAELQNSPEEQSIESKPSEESIEAEEQSIESKPSEESIESQEEDVSLDSLKDEEIANEDQKDSESTNS